MKTKLNYLGQSWGGLDWSPWVLFSHYDFKEIPPSPGVYRVKPVYQDFLTYIGQTGRSLRIRLSTLRKHTLNEKMPYNDPHTAAPCHWAWRKTHNLEFECAAAVSPLSERQRLGLECYLLWQYRLEYGESPLCSLGRYHPNYSRPTNRKEGRLGRLLPQNKRDDASLKSSPPLHLKGNPFDKYWMGLSWVNPLKKKVSGQGIYKILDLERDQVLYVGQSINLVNRLKSHMRRDWGVKNFAIWVAELPHTTLDHQRLELENDLLGACYSVYKDLPMMNVKRLSAHTSPLA